MGLFRPADYPWTLCPRLLRELSPRAGKCIARYARTIVIYTDQQQIGVEGWKIDAPGRASLRGSNNQTHTASAEDSYSTRAGERLNFRPLSLILVCIHSGSWCRKRHTTAQLCDGYWSCLHSVKSAGYMPFHRCKRLYL